MGAKGVRVMNKNGFFVTLPSNASMLVYLNNKIWQYRTKLANPIILQQPYEVGLIEKQYPRIWNSFNSDDAEVEIFDTKTKQTYRIELALGCFNLVASVECMFSPGMSHITMNYNNITNKVFFTGGAVCHLAFKGRLAEILGFIPDSVFEIHPNPHVKYVAPHPADIHTGQYNIFIYSDLVDYQLVGDNHVPVTICLVQEHKSRPGQGK